ncbi:putative COP9 signalosome complex subunit 2 [Trypanosoma vivax]|nr:putative COP9 signalosome complex subunit 2 [Trypanosoma vivax]
MDDYDYDDCEGDDGGWDCVLENAYLSAKALMDTDPERCAVELLNVRRDDPDGGRWTFKALKMLARLSIRTRAYENMLRYYEQVCSFRHPDVGKSALQKAMTKFIEECQRAPSVYVNRALELTIRVTSADLKSFGRLWFDAKLKRATLLMDVDELDAALEELQPVLEWCKEDDQLSSRRRAYLFSCYALILEAHSKRNDFRQMRDVFLAASAVEYTIPPSRISGSVLECGGKMYMHYRDWSSAFRAFSVAFRNYNETGDQRKISCLRYLVLACMLNNTNIDPFATQETKTYEELPEIAPVVQLMKAYADNNIPEFFSAIEKHSESLESDPIVHGCLEPLLEQLRLKALVAYAVPYTRLSIQRLEEVLVTRKEEVERLCLRAVMEGRLNAKLDHVNDCIILPGNRARDPERERLLLLNHWCAALLELSRKIYWDHDRGA